MIRTLIHSAFFAILAIALLPLFASGTAWAKQSAAELNAALQDLPDKVGQAGSGAGAQPNQIQTGEPRQTGDRQGGDRPREGR